MPYGSKVGSRNGKGFIHVLRPTPELWTLALPHRTQILYLADIAFVTSWLDIKPGSKVIEAGTGSGSFSHSTARTIGETGHLWSYEFHEARANKAREEFSRHGMDNIVTLTHRNVCKEGFTVVDTVDAVFLDLPAPWDAVPYAKVALRKDRPTRICCFSPCIEQVMRTVTALNQEGFTDITMYETLIRPQQVDSIARPPSISVAAASLKRLEIRKEEKRLRQIASAHRGKRKRADEEAEPIPDAASIATDTPSTAHTKKAKTAADNVCGTEHTTIAATPTTEVQVHTEAPMDVTLSQLEVSSTTASSSGAVAQPRPEPVAVSVAAANIGSRPENEAESEPESISVSRAFPEVRGHTSYLTFAVFIPPSMTGASTSSNGTPEPGPQVPLAVHSTSQTVVDSDIGDVTSA